MDSLHLSPLVRRFDSPRLADITIAVVVVGLLVPWSVGKAPR